MDAAYNQHSQYAKRSNRSSTSLNHLSLAPLTSRFPIEDTDHDFAPPIRARSPHEHHHRVSYIEGRSAPTTPGILSRSSSRVSLRKSLNDGLAKSKSSTNIISQRQHQARSAVLTPGGKPRKSGLNDEISIKAFTASDRNDSDWLLRAGALISSGTRESKGQTWLVSRASSTSLTGQLDEDEEALEQELARERESRQSSRRGSGAGGYGDADDEFSPITTRMMSFGPGSRSISRMGSRPTSRVHSRRGSRANVFTPMAMTDKNQEGYFDQKPDFVAEPDFVNVDEDVFENEQVGDDEIIVRRLARSGTSGLGTWVERLMGWSLFAVEEDGEDTDTETYDEKTDASEDTSKSKMTRGVNLDAPADLPEEPLPPPGAEEGGWQDAAWLLSVATKVLL